MKLKRRSRARNALTGSGDAQGSVMHGYLRWRHESRTVAASYQTWLSAAGVEREEAFARYLAALDREEPAASGYRRLVEHDHEG